MIHQSLKIVERPSVQPLTLQEAKDHLRVDTADEDTLIQSLIEAATDAISGENGYCANLILVQQTWDVYFPYFSDPMIIPIAPIIEIDEISYIDTNEVTQTLSASVYKVNDIDKPGSIHLRESQSFPSTLEVFDAVRCRVVAGYVSTDDDSPSDLASGIPAPIKAAMKLIIGDLYHNREGQALISGARYELNPTLKRLLDPYRIDVSL